MNELHLQLLGRFQVRRDGLEIPPAAFGGRKVRTLLRVLAVRRPDLVPHDALAEALWPDRLPADPAANLNVLVTRARRAVDDPAIVVTGPGGYALGPCRVDVTEFLDLATAARRAVARGDWPGALRAAEAALASWAEPLPEDAYADWARAPRERLARARLDTLETAATAALALGDPGTAVTHAEDVVTAEPLHEMAVLLLARALAARGDRAAALARLADLRRRLADDLGIEPSAEVEDLQLRLLRGELPAAFPGVGPAVTRPPAPAASPASGGAPFAELAFVGRDREVALLREAVAAHGVVIVAGPAGVGKSRLVAEALRGSGVPVIAARAYLPERAEAWGLARSVLREALALDAAVADALPARARDALAALVPEISEAPAVPLDGESRRALLAAGGLRVLEAATGDGAVLAVDDVQWADPSSLLLLASALARLPRLAGVLAVRPDEVAPGALAGVKHAREVTEISLGPLAPDAVETLVADHALADALVRGTDGTPFAVAEVVRELAARDLVRPTQRGWVPRDPVVVGAVGAVGGVVDLALEVGREGRRRAIRRRADQHRAGRLDGDVLALLALLAREAPARTIAAATAQPEPAVLDALTGLAAAGLARLGEHGWAPAHDLVGETVVSDLEPAQRGRLHALLAAALEADDADPSEIARHHRDAGDLGAAAAWYAGAARAASTTHATREAAALADAGLALAPRVPLRAALLEVRAEARAAHGEIAGAEQDLTEALRLDGEGGADRARRLARLAMLTFGAQDPRRAAELAELAVVAAAEDPMARAFALETAAIIDMNLGEPARAGERAEGALALYRTLGDAGGVAHILDGRAMATFLEGRIPAALDLFARVAQLFADAGELLRVVTPRSTLGHGLVFSGRAEDGLTEIDEALRLARELDAPEGQAYALWHRAEALSALGRLEEAEASGRAALKVAEGAGHRGWTATAHRSIGITLQAQGRLDEAAAAFELSAAAAGDDLTLFACWAAARGAMVAVASGRLTGAGRLVARALSTGPPLGHYEGRLAAVELAVARGDDGWPALAAEALTLARSGGHEQSASRLASVLESRRSGA